MGSRRRWLCPVSYTHLDVYKRQAYVDDSNPDKVGVNPYYKNNIANESYLLELGYLSNQSDLDILIKSQDKLANAISDAIIKELGL